MLYINEDILYARVREVDLIILPYYKEKSINMAHKLTIIRLYHMSWQTNNYRKKKSAYHPSVKGLDHFG